jgi:hypothetical protein
MRACGLAVYHHRHELYLGDVRICNSAYIMADGAVHAC